MGVGVGGAGTSAGGGFVSGEGAGASAGGGFVSGEGAGTSAGGWAQLESTRIVAINTVR